MKGLEDKLVGVKLGGILELASPTTRRVGFTRNATIYSADLSNINLLEIDQTDDVRHPRVIMKQLRKEGHAKLPLAAFDRYNKC